jgi:hypothetical protein
MNFHIHLLAFSLLLAVSACDKAVKENPDTAAALRLSPQSITIDDLTLTLEAFLWRDFMPPSEPGGSDLRSVVTLRDEAGGDITITPELMFQYIIHGDEVWKASFESVNIYTDRIEGFSNGGPKWGPDEKADVVVELEHEGTIFRILAKDQMITSTH